MTAPDFAKGVAYVRGQYVPIAEASIPMTDWGFLRSDATYDVVTVWDGSFFRLGVIAAKSALDAENRRRENLARYKSQDSEYACQNYQERLARGNR